MATERPNLSPSINFTETDLTTSNAVFGVTSLGLVGEFPKGRAFTPIEVDSDTLRIQCFGNNDPCKFEGTSQPIYEGGYIAQQYLTESNQLFITRVLGLSGYDAGDAWGISLGANLDSDTVGVTNTDVFNLSVRYADGIVTSATFDNTILQNLYDEGLIDDSVFGGVSLTTGDTITSGNQFIGDCDTFSGARFNANLIEKEETYICITGESAFSQTVDVPTEVQDCVVVYSGGTVTYNSRFVITVVNSIVLQNIDNNALTVVTEGVVTILGGTITHETNGEITMADCDIFLPNLDTISGGNYKICDLNGNVAVYDCETIDGINYEITTGTTIITNTVTTGGTTQIVSQIPSGLIRVDFTGSVTELSGSPLEIYDNSITMLLRSYATYDSDEILNFGIEGNTIAIQSIDGGIIKPTDDFLLTGVKVDGESFSYNVSLDPTKRNYLPRVFGSFIPCCGSDKDLYIESNFNSTFQYLLNNDLIYCIKPTICYNPNLNDYKEEYQGAVTPWIVSELRGNRVFRLFRVHTFSDGDAANTDVKVSITNIDPNNKTFTLQVRSYGDNDRRPTVLESYSRLTLRKQDNNYIGRVIGTSNGEYTLNSKYIMIEIANDCLDESFPAGFEGYPVRDYVCAQAPQIIYKTAYTEFERKNRVYLGLSDTLGIDSDMFKYKGNPSDTNLVDWTGTTKGYHMDVNATDVRVEGFGDVEFETGNAPFQNANDIIGTDYEKINSRKFTLVPYGGFDGWDIHRKRRTNTDLYAVNGAQGQKGLLSTVFDAYSDETILEGSTVINSDYYAYLKGIKTMENRDSIRINLLATPGINTAENSNLIEDTIEMVEEERCDTLYIPTTLDTNVDGATLSPSDVVNVIDGLYDTSYAATYYPWGQFFDSYNNTFLWLPPTAEVMRNFAFTDKVARPWFATAGKTRGITQFEQARKKVTMEDRDTLYQNRLNPLATFKEADGSSPVYIWGNKTLQIDTTVRSQVAVRRLLLYAQRLIEDVSLSLLFDPNSEEIRSEFENQVNPILGAIRDEQGLQNFRIELDRSETSLNSTEMSGKIILQPTQTLENININFVLTDSGAEFES